MSSSIAAETATPRMASSVRLRWRVSVAQARRSSIRTSACRERPSRLVASGEQLERRSSDESLRREKSGDESEHERQRHRERDDFRRHQRERERRAIHAAIVPVDDLRRRPAHRHADARCPSPRRRAASIITEPTIDRAEMPISRSAATSRRRSSTLSSMMQRRKTALATIVITPIAR